MGSFDAKLTSCDQSYFDFTGWDFEDGTMGRWTLTNEHPDYKWKIIQARNSPYKKLSNVYDHTTMTWLGFLAEVTSKSAPNGTRTIFKSVQMNNSKILYNCLSFSFWRKQGNDLLEIVQEINQNEQSKVRLF